MLCSLVVSRGALRVQQGRMVLGRAVSLSHLCPISLVIQRRFLLTRYRPGHNKNYCSGTMQELSDIYGMGMDSDSDSD